MKVFICLTATLLAFVIFQPSRAEEPTETPPPGESRILIDGNCVSFPFEVYRGDIRFRCVVNGYDTYMLLDDGYMWDDLLIWGGPLVDSLGLTYDGNVDVDGTSNDADKLYSTTASGITVGFPGVEFTNQRAVVMPSGSGAASWWSGSIGQISAAFFKHFIVGINFDSMTITLTKPDQYHYSGNGVAVAWEPMGHGPYSIPATLTLADGRRMTLKMFMDLGYNDQLQLWMGQQFAITAPESIVPISVGMNIQGVETVGFAGRLPKIDIGGYELNNVLVAYVPGDLPAQASAEAMIGLGLLSRFNLVFDYYHRRIFVEPTQAFSEPFEYDMSGLSTLIRAGDGREIVRIANNSPASDAGLRVGDRITHIDGQPIADYDFFDLEAMLRREGATVTLNVTRGQRQWQTSLKLRRLL